MTENNRILILYGTQTCTAKEIAESIWRTIKIFGLKGPVLGMDEYDISKLIKEEFAIFVCATTGQGDEPDNMRKFWRFLLRKNLPTTSLMRLKFGVIGLGDSSYSKFNFVGKKLHKRLIQLGASPLIDVGLCDYQHDLGHDAILIPWLKDFYSKLKLHFPSIQIENLKKYFVPRWKVSLLSQVPECTKNNFNEDIYFSKGIKNSLFNATCFEVDKNVRTTKETHFQDVRLITLKTMNHTVLKYKPGDVFNIRPRNSKDDIDELFQIFNYNNMDIKPYYRLLVEEQHEDMPVPEFLKQTLTLYEIAEQYWDLKCYPSQYVFSLLALVSDDKLERDKCIELSSPEGQEEWLNYSRRPKRTVLEVLRDFHKSASKLTIEILFEFFSPIKPRSFSIASSCLSSQGSSLDLLVAVVNYRTILKKDRLGLCSNWLSGLKLGDRIYGWIKNGTIQFPTDTNIPNILISPGTGLAPFRSFLQERVFEGSATKETLYLFFGCRYEDKDFHCREELERMVDDGKLTLFTAFSRDQENKIYVQHKIAEQCVLLWKVINEEKSCVFISGNAKNMPDNVRDSLVEEVFRKIGGLRLEEAKNFLKEMENNGRLQVEAW